MCSSIIYIPVFSGSAAGYGAPGGMRGSYNAQQGQAKRPKSITIPLPDFDFDQLIREKQNILGSIVNIKEILLSPVIGIGRQIVDTKLNLLLPLLAPVIGLKRTGLQFLRGLIDQKISLLDNFSSIGGSAGYGAPTSGYGVGRGRTRRGWTVGR